MVGSTDIYIYIYIYIYIVLGFSVNLCVVVPFQLSSSSSLSTLFVLLLVHLRTYQCTPHTTPMGCERISVVFSLFPVQMAAVEVPYMEGLSLLPFLY